MSQDQLAVFLPPGRTAFHPGERIDVTVLWALEQAPAQIEVRLFWQTRGKGTQDLEVALREWIMGPAVAGEQVVSLTLPQSPWSFSGKLVSLIWGVEVVAEPGGQNARCEFVLGPDAREVLLSTLDDAARA
jgi:hypothetical protein